MNVDSQILMNMMKKYTHKFIKINHSQNDSIWKHLKSCKGIINNSLYEVKLKKIITVIPFVILPPKKALSNFFDRGEWQRLMKNILKNYSENFIKFY